MKSQLNKILSTVFFVSVLICQIQILYGQPTNDNCQNAIVLTVDQSTSCISPIIADNTLATDSGIAHPCANYQGGDIWYKLEVPQGGAVIIETFYIGDLFDTGIAAYDMCGGNLLGCDDVGSLNNMSKLILNGLTGGDSIYIAVWQYGNTVFGQFELCAYLPPPPPSNDSCADAILIDNSAFCNETVTSNILATNSGIAHPCANYNGGDLWFKVEVPPSGELVIETDTAGIGNVFGTGIAVYESCGGNMITCVDSGAFEHPIVELSGLIPFDTLWIATWEYNNNDFGDFGICAHLPNPDNDLCDNALEVLVSNYQIPCINAISGSMYGATYETGSYIPDVWYKFTATSSSQIIQLLNLNSYDFTISVHKYSIGTACGDYDVIFEGLYGVDVLIPYGLDIGEDYYVKVTSNNTSLTFDICISEPTGVTNDDCINSSPLTLINDLSCDVYIKATTALATYSDTSFCEDISNPTDNHPDDDIWFQFTASSNTHLLNIKNPECSDTLTNGTLNCGGIYFEVFEEDCSDLKLIDCGHYIPTPVINTPYYNILSSLIIDSTYLLRFYSDDQVGYLDFDFCLSTPDSPPSNDECTESLELVPGSFSECENSIFGSTNGATSSVVNIDTSSLNCNNYSIKDDDVWYHFTAINSSHIVRVENVQVVWGYIGAISDNIFIEAFQKSCDSLQLIGCSNTAEDAVTINNLTIDSSYYVRVYTLEENVYADFSICVSTPPPPPGNDKCSNAIELPENPEGLCTQTINGSTFYATSDTFPPNTIQFNDSPDVWYLFKASATNYILNFSEIFNRSSKKIPSPSLGVDVFKNDCNNLEIICSEALSTWCYRQDPESCQFDLSLTLDSLEIDSSYLVRVSSSQEFDFLDFNVCLSKVESIPSNDSCINATELPISDSSCNNLAYGTTTGSSRSFTCEAGTENLLHDVWYKFTASDTIHALSLYEMEVKAGTGGLEYSIYRSSCDPDSLHIGLCNIQLNYQLIPFLEIGKTYFLKVSNANEKSISDFGVCVSEVISNDHCSDASSLVVNTDTSCFILNSGSLIGGSKTNNNCVSGFPLISDAWHTFVATDTIHTVSLLNRDNPFGGSCNIEYSFFYDWDCINTTGIDCNNSVEVFSGLTIGKTYYIKVHGQTYCTYDICVSSPVKAIDNGYCNLAASIPINPGHDTINYITSSLGTNNSIGTSSEINCQRDLLSQVNGETWYKFTASSTSHSLAIYDIVSPIGISPDNIRYSIFEGTCGGEFTSLICFAPLTNTSFDNLEIGKEYYVALGSLKGNFQIPYFNFKIAITTPPIFNTNNYCFSPDTIVVNTSSECIVLNSSSTLDATQSRISCNFNNDADDDVWFVFKATTCNQNIEISNVVGVGANECTIMSEVLSGSNCTNLESMICGGTSIKLTGLTVDEYYYLRVYTASDTAYANFDICITTIPDPPLNDECDNAIEFTLLNKNKAGILENATQSISPCSGLVANDVWYKVQPSGTDIYSFILFDKENSPIPNDADPVIEIFEGTCGNLMPVYCTDGLIARDTLEDGKDYYIRVYEKTGNNPFEFNITWDITNLQSIHDDCGTLQLGTGVSPDLSFFTINAPNPFYDNFGATASDTVSCNLGLFCDDVFHKFVPTGPTHILNLYDEYAYPGIDRDPVYFGFRVWDTCGGTIVHPPGKEALLTNLTPGKEYRIQLGSYVDQGDSTSGGFFRYNFGARTPPNITNDECSQANIMTVNPGLEMVDFITGSTMGANADPIATCISTNLGDIWYEFTATSANHLIQVQNKISHVGGPLDLGYEIYSGNCGGLTNIKCSEEDITILDGLTIGTLYKIRVINKDPTPLAPFQSPSYGLFDIAVLTPENTPTNNDCLNAIALYVNEGSTCDSTNLYSTIGATETYAGCIGIADDDIWFSFTATSSSHDISYISSNCIYPGDTIITEVYEGTCITPLSIVCTDEESVRLEGLIPGASYLFRAYTKNASNGCVFEICITTPYTSQPPKNDHANSAINLIQKDESSCTSGQVTYGTYHYATQSSLSACSGTSKYDVWYKFVANSSDPTIEVSGNQDIVVELRSADSTTLIICENTQSTNDEIILASNLDYGSTYLIRVYPYTNGLGVPNQILDADSSTFKICVYGPADYGPNYPGNTLPPILDEVFGYTLGNFSVSEQGSATYTIPLLTPPGTGGINPDLSLSYSSQGKNGLLGLGWSLNGLSAITRSGQTRSEDGDIKPITYSTSDRYLLDGERLVNFSNLPYGADGAEYRTTQNSFRKIVSYGSVLNKGTPEKFKVWNKAGLIMEYGYTSDSRIEAQGRHEVQYWLLNKVMDTKGNFMTISYQEDIVNGTYLPIKIEYTGNDSENLIPYCRIDLIYEDRPDISEVYFNGASTTSTKRLKKISAYNKNTLVREYIISYEQGPYNDISLLTSVQECGADGTRFPPTRFQWNKGTELFDKNPSIYEGVLPDNVLSFTRYVQMNICREKKGTKADNSKICKKLEKRKILPAFFMFETDLNGDGLIDVITKDVADNLTAYKNDGNYGFTDSTIMNFVPLNKGQILREVDMNVDGFPDLFTSDTLTGSNNIYINNKSLGFKNLAFTNGGQPLPSNLLSFDAQRGVKSINFFDMNGDALADALIRAENDSSYVKILINQGNNSYIENPTIPDSSLWTADYFMMDFNSDGLVDIMRYDVDTKENRWYKNTSTDSPDTIRWELEKINAILPNLLPEDGDFKVGDWNGDGVKDLIAYQTTLTDTVVSSNTLQCKTFINRGNLTFKSIDNLFVLSDDNLTEFDYFMAPRDINGDNADDLISFDSQFGILTIILNDGFGNFVNLDYSGRISSPIPEELLDKGTFRLVNYRNDNLLSFLWYNPQTGKNRIIDFNIDYNYGRIDTIINGLGQDIAIEYKPLTDRSVYQRANDAVYPEHDFFGLFKVVSSYNVPDGIGGRNSVEYRYKEGKVDMLGRGFRGFRTVETVDGLKKTYNVVRRDLNYKNINAPVVKSEAYLPNGQLLNETIIESVTDSIVSPYDPTQVSYFSYNKRTITKNYELDGQFISTIENRQKIDPATGNVFYAVVDYGGGLKDSTSNVYTDDFNKWHLGRLTRTEIHRSMPGKPSISRAVHFEYDPVSGLLVKEISDPDFDPKDQIIKEYVHDNYGNIVESRITAWDGEQFASRGNKSTFDPDGRYILSTKNDLDHTVSYTYDPIVGHKSSMTSVNGQTINYTYDGFGRMMQTDYPDSNRITHYYRKCQNDCPDGAVFYHLTESAISPPEITYFDILNREICKSTIGFNGNPIIRKVEYNKSGLKSRTTDPYFINDQPIWTNYEYDILNRPRKTIEPGNAVTTLNYDGLKTIISNSLGQVIIKENTVDGRLISVEDNHGEKIFYDHDTQRNLTSIQDPDGNVITMIYDSLNYQTGIIDPDMGTYTYRYNRFGELLEQVYPKGDTLRMQYDTLGRAVKRMEPEGETFWKYDSLDYGLGLLSYVQSTDYKREMKYDSLSRVVQVDYDIFNILNTEKQEYDQFSRIDVIEYATGLRLKNAYNDHNYLFQVEEESTGYKYFTIDDIDAYQSLSKMTYGNGNVTEYEYDPLRRWTKGIKTINGNSIIQDLTYDFDLNNNLKSKHNSVHNVSEYFEYDGLNRMIRNIIPGVDTTMLEYDKLGNITYKSDVGRYYYGENGAGPHQISRIEGIGSQCIPSATTNFNFYSFNKASQLSNDSAYIKFTYGPDRQRIRQESFKDSTLIETKIYVSGSMEMITDTAGQRIKLFIRGPMGVVAVKNILDGATETRHFWNKDYQGSVNLVSDESGQVLEEYNFDPWGMRRNVNGMPVIGENGLEYDRGYTSHEHLDLFQLINMGGRIQDPVLGRFISPDPHIQDMANLQNLNRYSYVLNNPTSFTDPSGFFFKSIGSFFQRYVLDNIKREADRIAKEAARAQERFEKATGLDFKDPLSAITNSFPKPIREKINKEINRRGSKIFGEENWITLKVTAVVVAVSIGTGGSGAGYASSMAPELIAISSGAASGFAGSYYGVTANGGSYSDAMTSGTRGAAVGAATAAATYGVGQLANSQALTEGNKVISDNLTSASIRIAGHGVVQGLSSQAQGGKFESGFISGVFSGAVDSYMLSAPKGMIPSSESGKFLFMVSAGGTGSVLGGGKFSNGAISATMTYLFNYKYASTGGGETMQTTDYEPSEVGKAITKMGEGIKDIGSHISNAATSTNGAIGVMATNFGSSKSNSAAVGIGLWASSTAVAGVGGAILKGVGSGLLATPLAPVGAALIGIGAIGATVGIYLTH